MSRYVLLSQSRFILRSIFSPSFARVPLGGSIPFFGLSFPSFGFNNFLSHIPYIFICIPFSFFHFPTPPLFIVSLILLPFPVPRSKDVPLCSPTLSQPVPRALVTHTSVVPPL